MDLAVLSLIALFIAILVSCTLKVNVGFLAIVFAWIIGVYLGGMSVKQVIAGFPSTLFLTLVGVTLLFTQAQLNGTLPRVASRAVRACRGNRGMIPIAFFFLAVVLATVGPGNIAAAALLAPMAMAAAGRVKIPAFLMAIMIGNGASAGSLSPFAPTGIIVNDIMNNQIGLGGLEWQTYFNNVIAHTAVAFGGYFLLGGWKLFGRNETKTLDGEEADLETKENLTFHWKHWATLAVIGLLIVCVIFFKMHVGMGAFAGALLLTLTRIGGGKEVIPKMPWGVIMLVTGVTVLISILQKTGGIELFSDLIASVSTTDSVTGVVAFITGLISVYSSTSGVVLPAFLPTVPGLVAKLGGDALAIASSMNVGSHLVDVSPVSTIGALCLASAPASEDGRVLFNKLLAWGLSMTVVGGVVCYVFFGLLS